MVFSIMQYLKVHLRKLCVKINQRMNGYWISWMNFFYDKNSGTAERVESNSRWTICCCCCRMLALRCCAGLCHTVDALVTVVCAAPLRTFLFWKTSWIEKRKCNRYKDSFHTIIQKNQATLNSNVIKYMMVMRYDQLSYKH